MLLSHSPQATESLKFGTLDLVAYKQFIRAVEDVLFVQRGLQRGKMATSYTKDEISVDLVDEYYADIDYAGHICYPVGVAAWPRSRSRRLVVVLSLIHI